MPTPNPVSFEEALEFLIEYLRESKTSKPADERQLESFKYEVWIPRVAQIFHDRFPDRLKDLGGDGNLALKYHAPVFLDAAWALARQGVLRPSYAWGFDNNLYADGGQGFSVTSQGREWLRQDNNTAIFFAHPGAYPKYLKKYVSRFGAGYAQRAEEALKCLSAGSYLAACAMTGAAAESIILATAITIIGENDALKLYRQGNGTAEITKKITVNLDERTKQEFRELTGIIKHWRNPSSHGEYVETDEVITMTALTTLVRLAQFVDSKWEQFTT